MTSGENDGLRVALVGTYVPDFPRNSQIRRLLERSGHSVHEVRADLWVGDRITLARRGKARAVARAISAYPKLVLRLLRMPRPDLVVVGYPGWFDMPFVALVCKLRSIPIVLDMFISLYDTSIIDRRLFASNSMMASVVRLVDCVSCRLTDRIILDTSQHADYVAALTGVARSKIGVVHVGADERIFYPRQAELDGKKVLFYGTFVPLHGLETILHAAGLVQNAGINLLLIGSGQQSQLVDELITTLKLQGITRRGIIPIEEIAETVATSAVVLGIFGESPKASRVVPNKLYQGIAMGRPVVTATSPAIDELFADGELITVPPADPGALASALVDLMNDSERRDLVGEAGRRAFEARFSEQVLAGDLTRELLVACRPPGVP